MRKLGLIGGIGPEATVAYYRQIIHGVGERVGAETLPPLIIESLSAFQVFSLCRESRLDELTAYLGDAVDALAAGGAQMAALTGNTPYVVFDRVAQRSPIPLISGITATAQAVAARSARTVGLLGTAFTMTNGIFARAFEPHGIRIVTPHEEEIALIQKRIETELEHGIVTDSTRAELVGIIAEMAARDGIDSVILGCTELPLILDDESSPVPCFDTVRIHVAALVDAILA